MGQGFFGYNPPQFVLDAAKEALDKVDCNQYSPTKVHHHRPVHTHAEEQWYNSSRDDRG